MAAGDITAKFGTAGTLTCTLASLADAAGRECTEVDLSAKVGAWFLGHQRIG